MWTAAGKTVARYVGGILVIGFVIGGALSWVMRKLLVGVHSPLIVMGVGGSDVLKAGLLFKPRFSGAASFVAMTGTMTVADNGCTHFALAGGGPTVSFPAGSSTTLTGVAIGSGKCTVSGSDSTGLAYTAVDVQVDVIAIPAGGTLGFYGAAAVRGTEFWANSWAGNIIINWLNLGRGGLCDEWAEWTSDFIQRNNDGTICLCELVYWPGTFAPHVCIRVTTCAGATCTGPVFYLDPHRESAAPVVPAATYVGRYGLPPGPNFTLWSATCATAATGSGSGTAPAAPPPGSGN